MKTHETLSKRKEKAVFSPDGKRPIIFHKLWHGISIWTKNGTDLLKNISKEGLMTSYFFKK